MKKLGIDREGLAGLDLVENSLLQLFHAIWKSSTVI